MRKMYIKINEVLQFFERCKGAVRPSLLKKKANKLRKPLMMLRHRNNINQNCKTKQVLFF